MLLKTEKIFTGTSIIFEVSEAKVHDICTIQDWKIVEFKYRIIHESL